MPSPCLLHYFRHQALSGRFAAAARGVGIYHLGSDALATWKLPLPPLTQQRRIAEVLDRADALRTKRSDATNLLDNLRRSLFVQMFGDPTHDVRGWPMRPLAELCSISGEYGAGVASRPAHAELPRYVRITDIDDRGVLSDEPVSPAGHPSAWDRYELRDGDLLLARSGATVGKSYLHSSEFGWCVFAGYLIRFRPEPTLVVPEFLYAYTKTATYKAWVTMRQRVVAQPNINAHQYGRELLVPTPPLELQSRFAAGLRSIAVVDDAGEKQAALLDAMSMSLQDQAFAGQL